jgi:hypothetical protein
MDVCVGLPFLHSPRKNKQKDYNIATMVAAAANDSSRLMVEVSSNAFHV